MLENAPPEIAVEILATLAGRRFGIIGFDGSNSRRISKVLSSVRALSVNGGPASGIGGGEFYDAVILSLAAAADPQMAPAPQDCRLPTLVVGAGDLLVGGIAAAYSWAAELLTDPWSDAEFLIRALRLLMPPPGRRPAESARSAPVVLIADDDPSLTSLLASILKGHGTCCYVSHDGLEALQMTRALVPNLLVLDLDMPQMNGFEVLESVRRQPGLETVLVALLTGCDQPDEVVRGSELGADEYIVKPIHPLVFVSRIKRLLRSGRLPALTSATADPPAGEKG